MAVDSHSRTPHPHGVVDRGPPEGARAEVGPGAASVHDQGQVLAGRDHVATGVPGPAPVDDVHAAVAADHQRGLAPLQGCVGAPGRDETAPACVLELEAAVEGRQQVARAGRPEPASGPARRRLPAARAARGRGPGACARCRSTRRRRPGAGIRGRSGTWSRAPARPRSRAARRRATRPHRRARAGSRGGPPAAGGRGAPARPRPESTVPTCGSARSGGPPFAGRVQRVVDRTRPSTTIPAAPWSRSHSTDRTP